MSKIYEYKIPENYNYVKVDLSEDDIYQSVELWDKYFEIEYKGINKSSGTEHWVCKNTRYPNLVHCNSELMAHKVCMVALYKIWWKKDKYIKIPSISTVVNRKSDNLLGIWI